MIPQVKFEFPNPHVRAAKGIYKINIGGKFYIGKADNLYARVYQHQSTLNWELRRYPMMKATQYFKWCRYIHENPSIEIATVHLIQRCETDFQAYWAEKYHLNEIKYSCDALNTVFEVPRPRCFFGGYDKKWLLDTRDMTRILYYNPDDIMDATYSHEPLTIHGKPRKR